LTIVFFFGYTLYQELVVRNEKKKRGILFFHLILQESLDLLVELGDFDLVAFNLLALDAQVLL